MALHRTLQESRLTKGLQRRKAPIALDDDVPSVFFNGQKRFIGEVATKGDALSHF